jgi:hypothetical protein
VVFNETSGGLDSGSGTFFNINVTKLSSAMKESFRMQRCTQGEIDTMMKSSDQARSALAQKRLAAM